MLNRPDALRELTQAAPLRRNSDGDPVLRSRVLFLFFLLPLVAIGGRVAYLQCVIPERFSEVFEVTTESWEDLPARDGRILAADGTVLAGDRERNELQVHYRWLQDPPDADWLKQQAWLRLSRRERREEARVLAAQQQILQERTRLWQDLAQLTGCSLEDLTQIRTEIQTRVERLAAHVNEHHRKSRNTRQSATSQPAKSAWWQLQWDQLVQEFTAPPARTWERLEIAEEVGYHVVLPEVPREVAVEVESRRNRYPGTKIAVSWERTYPQHDLAVHVIGVRKPLQREEIATLQSKFPEAREGDLIGRSGLERGYDQYLRGVRGQKRLVRNRRGEVIHEEIAQPARPGRDLVLTLDAELQNFAEQALDQALQASNSPASVDEDVTDDETETTPATQTPPPVGGALVAIDVQTGAVLTLAAAPRYDLNLLVRATPEAWNAVLHHPQRPLFPRATQMALPPGSVFKPLAAIAFIESGRLDPLEPISCAGYLDRPEAHRCLIYRHYGVGHGETTLVDALRESCNVYFFRAARQAGPKPLIDWATRFGVGQKTGLDFASEEAGRLPNPETPGRRWYPGDTLGLSIGQSSLMVTPLQMARIMAGIANDGLLVTPHLASQSGPQQVDENDEIIARSIFQHPEARPIPGLHRQTLAHVRAGLEAVVNHPRGSAYKTVRLPEVTIAGKTGTAEVQGQPDHAWFAGYVPAERPRIAFCVVLEHGGSGGRSAGPLAQAYIRKLLQLGLITGHAKLADD